MEMNAGSFIPQCSAEFVVIHVWLRLPLSPSAGNFIGVGQLEFAIGALPRNYAGKDILNSLYWGFSVSSVSVGNRNVKLTYCFLHQKVIPGGIARVEFVQNPERRGRGWRTKAQSKGLKKNNNSTKSRLITNVSNNVHL